MYGVFQGPGLTQILEPQSQLTLNLFQSHVGLVISSAWHTQTDLQSEAG